MLSDMPNRAMYVRLRSTEEMRLLQQMAAEQRRQPMEQAAWLVSEGLARWTAQKQLEAALEDDEPWAVSA